MIWHTVEAETFPPLLRWLSIVVLILWLDQLHHRRGLSEPRAACLCGVSLLPVSETAKVDLRGFVPDSVDAHVEGWVVAGCVPRLCAWRDVRYPFLP